MVGLSLAVSKAIQEEVLAAIWECNSQAIETGGHLYALYPPDERPVAIIHATGPGPQWEARRWQRSAQRSE